MSIKDNVANALNTSMVLQLYFGPDMPGKSGNHSFLNPLRLFHLEPPFNNVF
jgi:hypothetical protein